MTTDIIVTAGCFVLGIICLILFRSAVKQHISHRYGENEFVDIVIGMNVVGYAFATIAVFVLTIIGLATILYKILI